MTLTLILVAACLLVMVGTRVLQNRPTGAEAEARKRAERRQAQKQFANTVTEPDWPACAKTEVLEFDDKYDGRGDLTEEQLRTIDAIFDNHEPAFVAEDPWKSHRG